MSPDSDHLLDRLFTWPRTKSRVSTRWVIGAAGDIWHSRWLALSDKRTTLDIRAYPVRACNALGEVRSIETESAKLSGEGTSVADLLKLFGNGANGPILMALGPRSLRTKKLTEKVPTYAPRTVYRHARTLSQL